jgi:ABC-type transport system involved in cytochrome c biogenesis permease component
LLLLLLLPLLLPVLVMRVGSSVLNVDGGWAAALDIPRG